MGRVVAMILGKRLANAVFGRECAFTNGAGLFYDELINSATR